LNFRFGDFEINVARQELRRAGATVHIEPQVFDLLVHLIRHRDRIVSKDELIDVIWQGRIVSEATLSSRISAARRALGDSGNDQSFIRTLHKRGFRFVGDVDEDNSAPTAIAVEKASAGAVEEAANVVPTDEPRALPGGSSDAAGNHAMLHAARGAGAAPLENRTASNGRQGARNLRFAAAVIVLASLSVSAAWWLLSSSSQSPAPHTEQGMALASEAASSAERLKESGPSIVVLPFVNLSGDAQRDYLADGITDSLISDLAHVLPGISIVSRDTAFTYKGRGADARQIGRELEVRYLLEGSVVPEGDRVRVNTRLVETKEASQLWAERFDAERGSILDVQDEIVSRVSRAIGLQVVGIEARRSLRERPDSPELTDLIMRGKAVLNLPSSPATMIQARDLFELALTVQPTSVDGLAGVATTLVFEFLNGYYETGGEERLGRAERLLNLALAIEPRHIMALKANAALRRAQGRFEDAIVVAEAVIMENPGEP
jgi:TolB-like protein/DNA-binding winged helix-turn-helix (wHTH) protein